jgi:ferredoxin-NADP reductase
MRENGFAYAPGQFVFVSFRSRHVSREAHPFTLSSSPSRPGALEMTIRASGDWTGTVDRLAPGDRAWIQGPFGRFGHLFVPPNRELVMIAGGIGITPMLSMLRFLADQEDRRAITLIWSNRSKARLVYTEELNRLAAKLTGLRQIHIFTRENGVGEQPGRLTLNVLKDTLRSENRAVTIFLCGPPKMMKAVRSALVAMGFAPGSIRTETFGL